jgi:hypothetical protein
VQLGAPPPQAKERLQVLVHRTVHELGEAAGAPADELFLVTGEDMSRWADEAARLRTALAAEGEA